MNNTFTPKGKEPNNLPILRVALTHSQDESRYYYFGLNQDKTGILTVRFTYRFGCIRIFDAGYWRKCKKTYEQTNSI